MPSDPLNLEPKNGDFVDYIESLQASSQKNLDGITPPMTADHHRSAAKRCRTSR